MRDSLSRKTFTRHIEIYIYREREGEERLAAILTAVVQNAVEPRNLEDVVVMITAENAFHFQVGFGSL